MLNNKLSNNSKLPTSSTLFQWIYLSKKNIDDFFFSWFCINSQIQQNQHQFSLGVLNWVQILDGSVNFSEVKAYHNINVH